jgi:hypothetical protein
LDAKVEWVEPGGKIFGLISSSRRPDAAQRVEAVGQRLAEHDHIRLDVEVLDRPQLAGAVEAHLYFVDHHQNAVLDRAHA